MNKSHIDALASAITAAIVAFYNTFPATETVDETEIEVANDTDVTGQLDSAGFPWDERIHSSTKSKKDDGTWTARRGAKNLVASVEAELRAKGFGAPATTTPAAPVATPAAPVAPAPVMPALNIPAPVAAPAPVTEYSKLCDLIASNSAANGGRLNDAWVTQLFTDNGVPGGLPSLANDEARSKVFFDAISGVLAQ